MDNGLYVKDVNHLIDLISQGKHRYRVRAGMSHCYIDYVDDMFDVWYSSDDTSEKFTVEEIKNPKHGTLPMALTMGILKVDD